MPWCAGMPTVANGVIKSRLSTCMAQHLAARKYWGLGDKLVVVGGTSNKSLQPTTRLRKLRRAAAYLDR